MSDPESIRPSAEKEIFFAALNLETVAARVAFLDQACEGNPRMGQGVDQLLANHFENDAFLDESAMERPPGSAANVAPAEAPNDLIGRYRLLEKIGEGAAA